MIGFPSDPGSRNPRAGLSNEERIAALEQAMRMAPQVGAAATNGSVVTWDSTQVGGVKWASRSRFDLVAQAQTQAASLTTTNQVVGSGVLRAFSSAGDAIVFRYESSEWTVGGVAPTFLFVSTFSNNATAPGVTLNAGLAQITAVGGGAGVVSYSAGGSLWVNAHSGMTAGLISHLSQSVTLTSGQSYLFYTGTASGSQAANSATNLSVRLYATWPA